MPPRELPGLYYDHERQKYFPIASKPRPPAHTTLQPVTPADDSQRIPSASTHRICQRLQLSQRSAGSSVAHVLMAGHWARPSLNADAAALPLQSHSQVTAFGAIPDEEDAEGVAFAIGTSDGGIHTCKAKDGARRRWNSIYYMQSRASAICTAGSSWIATSFGSPSEIYFAATPIDSALRTVCLSLSVRYVQDVRAATFDGRTVVLGGRNNLVVVDSAAGVRSTLPVGSDVLSLCSSGEEVVCGARNGTVRLFDARLPASQHAPDLLHGRLAKTAAAHVRKAREWLLVVGSLAGHLEAYDLRFLRRDSGGTQPVMLLRGHVNSYAMNLPMETDKAEDFLFAAGQDRRVRMWSLLTGEGVAPPPSAGHFLCKEFESPVVGLHVDRKDGLYAVCENSIEHFR